MCEETENYMWAQQDRLGRGATSEVFKAYNKATGELVAAKVYQSSSSRRTATSPDGGPQQNQDYRPLLDREMEILKAAKHENIVRYIALEDVIPSETSRASIRKEALFIEYCNGGSLNSILSLPENRYGLVDHEFMLVFKHLTNALKYLHEKHTIHRDIKPDNIMLSININGERTYKLADLGVARLINEGEDAFTTLVGTEEYIHPDLYRAAVHDNTKDSLRTSLQTRVAFPFEVDLWSLGITLYQCATGELPFQPFAGTRKDRTVMRRILETKTTGMISGVEQSPGGTIEWSNKLPDSSRLSVDLRKRLESLLQRLLESDRSKLMSFQNFFNESDKLLRLIPIYYLNLKRFILTCSYFEPTQPIGRLHDELNKQNNDAGTEEYFCLFQNIPYPISKEDSISVSEFCDQLPSSTSSHVPLVFYTFSCLTNEQNYVPKFFIPKVKQIRNYNDVAAACDWSKDMVGLFFNLKSQLLDYQQILQTAQCSTTIMQKQIKSKMIEFLCMIREKLIIFRAIEELKLVLDQIDRQSQSQTNLNQIQRSPKPERSKSIGNEISTILTNAANAPTSDSSLSPVTGTRSTSSSSMQLIQQSIRIYLRSFLQPYNKLKKCEHDVLKIIQDQFGDQSNLVTDDSPFTNTLWSSERTKAYSTWIPRADKLIQDLIDLNDSFRKDRLLSTYNRLQSDSHFRRRKNLEIIQETYIQFINDDCYPNLIQAYHDYNEWTSQRASLLRRLNEIEQSYEIQCEQIADFVDMVDDLRQVVYKNIRELTLATSMNYTETANSMLDTNVSTTNEPFVNFTTDSVEPQSQSVRGLSGERSPESTSANKNFMKKIRGKTRQGCQQVEESFLKLDSAIRHFRSNIHKK